MSYIYYTFILHTVYESILRNLQHRNTTFPTSKHNPSRMFNNKAITIKKTHTVNTNQAYLQTIHNQLLICIRFTTQLYLPYRQTIYKLQNTEITVYNA